ncbi:hypothetical protein CDCA_CDCA03G0990 [Cyanidium caldarium]|uniref:Peroxisomal membrane protein MPV17 n=1 Tax=Cyanidium caldarium TaxID=2771 RepID=A0AAV9IRN6_CYACA|nr:hypothetical protein CDCA_CDCA03G0990 [Cyanidium caldarium]
MVVTGLSSSLQQYMLLLRRRPVSTKALTAFGVAVLGDVVAQYIEWRSAPVSPPSTRTNPSERRPATPPYNLRRTLVFATFMGFVGAPISHYWYEFLARRFPGTSWRAVGKRVAADQLGLVPIFLPTTLFCLDYAGRKYVEREPADRLPERAAQTAWRLAPNALVANWMLWPAAQTVNFMFVPGELQVLFVNVVGVGWNAVLSLMAASQPKAKATPVYE